MATSTLPATTSFFGTPSAQASPFPWSSFVLTPSLFTSRHGTTPFGSSSESNPFDLSFSGIQHKAFTVEDLDLGTTSSDLLALPPRRKRALSSPAMTPGGFGAFHKSFGDAVEKRQKLESDTSSVATSSIFGGSRRDSDTTISSAATPVDPKANVFTRPYGYDELIDTKPIIPQVGYQSTIADLHQSSAPQTIYQPFSFAPPQASYSTFQPSFSTGDISVSGDSVAPAATSLPVAPPAPAPAPKANAKGKAAAKNSKRARSDSIVSEDDAADEEAKRKALLERNRVAACKSRRKKKERVGNLESDASEFASRNVVLQSTALALRQELLQLRHVLDLHDSCSCEHVLGYRAREKAGGGIPAIEGLAGRTLTTNYQNVPTMGSEDDCFADLFRWERDAVSGVQIMVEREHPRYEPVGGPSVNNNVGRGRGASTSVVQLPMNEVISLNQGPAIPLRTTRGLNNKTTRQNTFAALSGQMISSRA